MQDQQIAGLVILMQALRQLSNIVLMLTCLYEADQWLNDVISIESILPMSLDEWHLEINAKIDEIGHILEEKLNDE